MNPLDLGVIGIIAISAIFAFARGFVREALSIVAWVGAAVITRYGFDRAYVLVDPYIGTPFFSQLVAGFGLFLISLIVLTIATGFIARSVRSSGLSAIDRTLGFIFGLARGAFIVSLAYLLLETAVQPTERPPWIQQAKSGPYLHDGAELLRSLLPEQLRLKSASTAEDAIKAISPAIQAGQAIRALEKPGGAAQGQPEASPPAGYKPGERRDMDRLFGTQR